MKKVSVSGSPRENVGKKDAKTLRRQGLVPCVMYGGKEQLAFALPELSFKDIIYTPESCVVELKVDKKSYEVILQDAQFHPVTGKVIHCDFLQVSNDKPVKIDIPISVSGAAPGVLKGGKLITKLRKLRVKGLIQDMPDQIDINISKLDISDSVKVGQLEIKGLEFLNPANAVVVIVKMTRGAGMGEEEGEEEEGEEGEEQAAEGGEATEEKAE